MSIKVSELTAGERLTLFRRRCSQSQTAFCRDINRNPKRAPLTLHQLKSMEGDLIPVPERISRGIALRSLASYEQCFIARRRSGVSQAKVAADLGRCRYWVNRMELGLAPCHELTSYWFA